ncbi:MAG: aspartate-semialdehyde dehydrogenase [Acidobacteriota bacterium]
MTHTLDPPNPEPLPTRSSAPRIPVAVLGATGSVGQRFVSLLHRHPWFRIAELTASERSAGKPYGEAARWMQAEPLPEEVAEMPVVSTDPKTRPLGSKLLFSGLDSRAADRVETPYAAAGHFVVSNAKSHRMDPDVPLVVPEVNPDHLGLLDAQRYADGGGIVTNPNCSTIGLVMALKPLVDAFGVEAVHVVSLQAVSGAGIPGVPSMAALDNIVPFIGGEEDKLENETGKILGRLVGHGIEHAAVAVSAQCTRVPVIDGHTLCVSLRPGRDASLEEIGDALASFTAEPQRRGLPTAPERPIHVLDQADRPQPRLDRDRDGGMAAVVGRLRPCPLLGVKFVTLSHNTLRGAAGGSILLAELALAQGRIPGLTAPTP